MSNQRMLASHFSEGSSTDGASAHKFAAGGHSEIRTTVRYVMAGEEGSKVAYCEFAPRWIGNYNMKKISALEISNPRSPTT